jgi:NAD(P)-dependent dehydrogenase (short-subunit alcohol dehydrogenase family)
MTTTTLPSPSELFDLSGRVAVVTGGAGHLGGVFARVLAGAGARIAIVDVDGGSVDRRIQELRAAGAPDVIGVTADVGNEAQVADTIDQVVRAFGRLDVLVNNAATKSSNFFAPLREFPLEDWDHVLRVNLTGMFLCARAAEPLLVASGKGSIINVASIYGVSAPDQRIYDGLAFNTPAIYSASKAGVIGLTKHLATYYAGGVVRCNAVTPGGVFAGQPDRFVQQYSARTPMGRMARSEEIAPAVLYLASDASAYVTGHNLIVDGGWTAW